VLIVVHFLQEQWELPSLFPEAANRGRLAFGFIWQLIFSGARPPLVFFSLFPPTFPTILLSVIGSHTLNLSVCEGILVTDLWVSTTRQQRRSFPSPSVSSRSGRLPLLVLLIPLATESAW